MRASRSKSVSTKNPVKKQLQSSPTESKGRLNVYNDLQSIWLVHVRAMWPVIVSRILVRSVWIVGRVVSAAIFVSRRSRVRIPLGADFSSWPDCASLYRAFHYNPRSSRYDIQSTLVISNSLISNNRLSRSESLVPVITQRSTNRQKNIVEKRRKLLLLLFSTIFSIYL